MLLEIFLLLSVTLCRNAMEILQFANKVISSEVAGSLRAMLDNG
jgi:hypothetical protein